ncbi:putative casein kinase II, regulatory subunit, casein kinase II subunit beta [Helianthus annuus]|nr:putative casein kinase II, regulatory subunit, casein kinase II subunit beta [Helianthus annuus]
MYRERGGGGSKAKMERSSTATSSRAGFNFNGKDSTNKDSANSKISRASFPNKKLSKGEENVVEESETDSEESDVSGSDGEDDFNLCGLSSQVPYYEYALDLILDVESSHGDMFSEEQNEIIESAAEMLYGLIHVRYILTTKGLAAMLEKYKNAEFGRCPRVYCCGQPCLPVGQSDVSRQSNVKIFCPKCEDIYTPQSRFQDNLDGAYFGSTFPHLFLMTYGHLKPQKTSQDYIPRVFGFKVHKP